MITYLIPAIFFALFLFVLGIALGHSAMTLKLRREENQKLNLDNIVSKEINRDRLLSNENYQNYDELAYRANIRREIENITRER